MRSIRAFLTASITVSVLCAPLPVLAQDQQTLADIRQELTVLHVEIQRLNRELSTTGAPSTNLAGTSVLDRVEAIEMELQRLTAQTEQLEYRINRIVADGTNRIGDLEFRLVELEGGDIAALGKTTTLGGDTEGGNAETPAVQTGPTEELAVGERADFDAAKAALENGSYQEAADKFAAFNAAYPGSPLAAKADFHRGKAMEGLGDTREAARAYLASFTGDAVGPMAPDALFELGAALGRLGQVDQACITLSEVGARFAGNDTVAKAQAEMARLSCS
ncbi:tol-pal system protein YbgF [Phycobacter sp. K97]|uniref:tol-pal system protein YbgF n=1 Tax=Phycobacter sedimenti TaxID=3133977 RepID=UPI00311E0583